MPAAALTCDPELQGFLAKYYATLEKFSGSKTIIDSIREAYRTIIARSDASLTELLDKGFRVDDEVNARSVLLQALLSARKSIRAISPDRDQEAFWQSKFGQQFRDANISVIKRGILVDRVYVLNPDDKVSASPQGFLKQQSQLSTTARWIPADHLRQGDFVDFMIVDDEYVVTLDGSKNGLPTSVNLICTSPLVDWYRKCYSRIQDNSLR
jgi:hypothetical protein